MYKERANLYGLYPKTWNGMFLCQQQKPKLMELLIDPLDSTSTMLQPRIVGEEHYETAQQVKQTLQRYKELQDIIAILGLDELSEEDRSN